MQWDKEMKSLKDGWSLAPLDIYSTLEVALEPNTILLKENPFGVIQYLMLYILLLFQNCLSQIGFVWDLEDRPQFGM